MFKFKKNQKVLVSWNKKDWHGAYFLRCRDFGGSPMYEVHYGEPWAVTAIYRYCKKASPEDRKNYSFDGE